MDRRLADVEEHHEWSELAFFGVGPTDALRRGLEAHGVDRFEATEERFVARRAADAPFANPTHGSIEPP